jgi:hypothetical protein
LQGTGGLEPLWVRVKVEKTLKTVTFPVIFRSSADSGTLIALGDQQFKTVFV